MPQATYRRFIGIARELGRSSLAAATNVGATSLTLNLPISGAFTATSKITIYDGANTEVVTASAWAPGTGVLTVGATANAHGPGCLVTTVGAASAGPSDYIPVTKFDPFDNVTLLEDNGWRGSVGMPYDLISGIRHGEIDISGDVFPDTYGYYIGGVLGDVTFTASTPNTHAIALKNSGDTQPSTFQLTDVYLPNVGTGVVRQYGSVVFSEVTLKFTAEGMLSYDAKAMANASGLVALPTASFSAIVPLPTYVGSVTVNSVVSPLLVDGQVSIKRNVEVIHNIDGSPDPYKVWAGEATVDGNLTVITEDETFLNYYLNNTKPPLDLNFSTGSGASLLGVRYHLNKCGLKNGKPNASKSHLEHTFDLTGVMNTTDAGASGGYSPCKVTLSNAKATGTFG
jgi:hypothetical protein